MIDVTQYGAVLLGPDVVCDGFYADAKGRVQTHVHLDHMYGFNTSKGIHKIFMSKGTYDIIVVQQNADIPIRTNIRPINYGETFGMGESKVCLLSSRHILGAAQVQVSLENGNRIGYSGDFDWPLEKVIQVETLVVDATYGSPCSRRNYTRNEAMTRLLEIVFDRIRYGPIHLIAHRGTLQRAIDLLDYEMDVPVIASDNTINETRVYQVHGYSIPDIYKFDSGQGKQVLSTGRYIRIFRTGEHRPEPNDVISTIILSCFMGNSDDPVLEHAKNTFRIALTAHADFNQTLEYIKATGATKVITDNSRGGKAVELAHEIKSRLGINAMPSTNSITREWCD